MNRFALSSILALILLVSCTETNEVIENVNLTVTNLPALAAGEGRYQLWASFTTFAKTAGINSPQHDSGFVSLGEFIIDANGTPVALDGGPVRITVPQGQDLQLINDVVLTLQTRSTNQEPRPVIIGGKFHGDASRAIAQLDMSYVDAFGSDFSAVSGSYAIMAPTSVAADSNSGIWFVNRTPTLSPGLLNLPALTSWTYEGWVVDNLDPNHPAYYSTGKFLVANTADFDSAGPGRGAGAGLNFPGQDFINGTPARPNLRDSRYAFMVTLEPFPDNSPNPFYLKILASAPAPPAALTLQNVAPLYAPRATVTIAR